MAQVKFYKDSTNGFFVVGNHRVPSGLHILNVSSDDLAVSIRGLLDTTLVTDLLKESGSAYTNLAELLAATKDFFFRVAGNGIPRVRTIVSADIVTPDLGNYDVINITAQAESLTISNPIGTPNPEQTLVLNITDNGTPVSVTFESNYVAGGSDLISTTIASKQTSMIFVNNDNKIKLRGLAQE